MKVSYLAFLSKTYQLFKCSYRAINCLSWSGWNAKWI